MYSNAKLTKAVNSSIDLTLPFLHVSVIFSIAGDRPDIRASFPPAHGSCVNFTFHLIKLSPKWFSCHGKRGRGLVSHASETNFNAEESTNVESFVA